MLDNFGFTVVGCQIIIFIPPDQGPGADALIPTGSGHQFLLQVPVQIHEGDLPVLLNGAMNGIDVIIDALIFRLNSACNIDLTLQLSGIVFPGDLLQLSYQISGFLRGNEAGGLYCIHQQLQFRKFKLSTAEVIAASQSALHLYHIVTEVRKTLHIAVNTLPFCMDSLILQVFYNIRSTHGMFLIRVLLQHFNQI